MGIDVYLKWRGQSEEEHRAQITGFSVDAGNVGYLREAYHGGPYATKMLCAEGFDDTNEYGAPIPASVLRERLPTTVAVALYRHHLLYEQADDPAVICADKQSIGAALASVFTEKMRDTSHEDVILTEEQAEAITALVKKRELPDYALAFADFVELAERKETETGKPCGVYVSW